MYQNFNWRLLRRLQGEEKKDQLPYIDDITVNSKRMQRIFISSEFFNGDFEKFKILADAAKGAHFLTDSYTGGLVRRSDAPPLANQPSYLIERLPVGMWVVWVNVMTRKEDFYTVLAKGTQECTEARKAYEKHGDPALKRRPTTKYCSELNEPTDDFVNIENMLKTFGIK